jgi:hypothetical protein
MFKLHFFNESKGCIKFCNWFQSFCTTKRCPVLWKYMFIGWIWWNAKSYKNVKVLKFWGKRLYAKYWFLKPIWQKHLYSMGSKCLALGVGHTCKK